MFLDNAVICRSVGGKEIEFGSRERENVLGLSFVVDVGKSVLWWNSDTNVGRAALCWKFRF
jgi:hypothetical protein